MTINTPERQPVIEHGQSMSPFIEYVNERLSGQDWIKASNLTRSVDGGVGREEYKMQVKEVGRDIIQVFGIAPELFQDKRYAECLLAVCDGYLVNMRKDPTSKEFEKTKMFLTSAIRTLAGLRSRYNKDEFEANSPDAPLYYTSGEDEKETERFKKIKQHVNVSEVDKVRGIFNDWSPQSAMCKTRKMLGIIDKKDEVEFEVYAVKTRIYTHDNEEEPSWAEIVGIAKGEKVPFSAFKDVDPETGRPVIVMPDHIIGLAIEEHLLGHEYVHTQREFSFGFNNNLGFIFEETLANLASGSEAHFAADRLISLLNRSLGDDSLVMESRLVLNGEKSMGEYFQYVANTFGFRSLLLLLTTSPPAYEHSENFLDPAIKNTQKERMGSLLAEVLKESDEINPERRNRLLQHFSSVGGRSAGAGMDVTDYWKLNSLLLPKDLQESFDACFFDPYTQSYLPDNHDV